jgi:hypothetical protein
LARAQIRGAIDGRHRGADGERLDSEVLEFIAGLKLIR